MNVHRLGAIELLDLTLHSAVYIDDYSEYSQTGPNIGFSSIHRSKTGFGSIHRSKTGFSSLFQIDKYYYLYNII